MLLEGHIEGRGISGVVGLYHNKIYHLSNYLIFFLGLQAIARKYVCK